MKRALELAALGKGSVSPNPLVGCVIVHDHVIIGEGWHQRYGDAHAEVQAVRDVTDKTLLPESTVYVNLEPCSHTGKTPPCADMLVRERVKKVVIANKDTNPLVDGGGIKKLNAAGIEVVTGVLEAEARALNRRFFSFIEKKRPYIILKWAQTSDGFIARENYDSKWISNEYARQLVHKWRTEEDAVLVGTNTARYDNPQLNVRDWSGRNPARIVIDKSLMLDHGLHLFDGRQRTLCYNLMKQQERDNLQFVRLEEAPFLHQLLHDLYDKRIQSVIVEGGARTLHEFIQAGLWDEARIFTAPGKFERGIPAPSITGNLISTESVMGDMLNVYYNR